jgi:hypothetical protein
MKKRKGKKLNKIVKVKGCKGKKEKERMRITQIYMSDHKLGKV